VASGWSITAPFAAPAASFSHCPLLPSSCLPCPAAVLQHQSSACLSCSPGSFAYSWGSAYCKSCIEGTYAPQGTHPLAVAGLIDDNFEL
jgi:hypothetical protein